MKLTSILKKGIISDFVLNILAVVIGTAVLQLLVLPQASKSMSAEDYGTMLATVSAVQLVAGTVGNALNNVRLLKRHEDYQGSYNVLVMLCMVLVAVIMAGYCIIVEAEVVGVNIMLTVVASIALMMNEYYSVYLRLRLNYSLVLLSSIFMSVMYLAGLLLLNLTGHWQFIYAMAYIMGASISIGYGKPWSEGAKFGSELGGLTIETAILVASKFLNRIMSYADKVVLHGLLGGTYVSVYYVAGLLGKCLSMVITPINNVVLSYLCAGKNKNEKAFDYTLIFGSIVCAGFYVITLVLERPFLNILYPEYVDEAMQYIAVTNATAIIMALVSMLEPFVLRFCKLNVQLILNGSVSLLYLLAVVVLGINYKLMGFCIGCLVAYVFRTILVVILYKTKQKESCTGGDSKYGIAEG